MMASVKFSGKHPDSSNIIRVCVRWLLDLVPGSVRLIFPGNHIMEDMYLIANSNLMELTSPRMDRSVAERQVDKVENKSLESTIIHRLTSVPRSSSRAFTNTFPSSIASHAASVSADVTEFTGRYDF